MKRSEFNPGPVVGDDEKMILADLGKRGPGVYLRHLQRQTLGNPKGAAERAACFAAHKVAFELSGIRILAASYLAERFTTGALSFD